MTEPHIRMLEATEAKAAASQEAMDTLRSLLDREHEKALESNPYGTFVLRLPVEAMAKLTPQERDQLEAYEFEAFHRHQPMAQAKEQQRGAFVRAGGEAEAFDSFWELGGKDAHAAQAAEELLERAHTEGNVF